MSRQYWIVCFVALIVLGAGMPAAAFQGVDVEALTEAAEEGDSQAQVELGVLYSQGIGVPAVDKAEALKWYTKSAEQGNANGQWNLAFMYIRGDGVEQDLGLGRQWLRKAADQGYAPAQFDLGYMLWMGMGGEADQEEALKQLRRSANQGYAEAVEALKKIEEEDDRTTE